MTKAEVMARLAIVKDIDVDEWYEEIKVTVQDFGGFDEDYKEIDRQYDRASIKAMEGWLEEHCESCDYDYYDEYKFADCVVCVGYASFNI